MIFENITFFFLPPIRSPKLTVIDEISIFEEEVRVVGLQIIALDGTVIARRHDYYFLAVEEL